MIKICVVVLIGLPGAGKTSFCINYIKHVKKYNVIHICYDEIIKFNTEEHRQELYKENRKEILVKIKNLIRYLISGNNLSSLIESIPTDWYFVKLNDDCKEYIILIDDNNYYVGMRYEFYKICREFELSFAQIYFQMKLVKSININLNRINNRIPEFVIQRMYERFQVPNLKWEENTIHLLEDQLIDFNNVDLFLAKSLNNPQKIQMKVQNSQMEQSKVHEIDLLLRKQIKNILESRKCNENLNVLAKNLNDIRKSILNDIRVGILEIDLNQCEKYIQLLSI